MEENITKEDIKGMTNLIKRLFDIQNWKLDARTFCSIFDGKITDKHSLAMRLWIKFSRERNLLIFYQQLDSGNQKLMSKYILEQFIKGEEE